MLLLPQRKPPVGSTIDRSNPYRVGMLGCWLLNEGSIYFSDISGRQLNGSFGIAGGSVVAPGGIQGNGSDCSTALMDANDPTAFTIIARVRPRSVSKVFFGRWDGGGGFSHYPGVDASLKATVSVFDGGTQTVTAASALTAELTYTIAATALNGDFLHLYVDGIEVGTPAAIGTMWTGGDRWLILATKAGPYWDGFLEYLYLYDYAMSIGQIAALTANPYMGIVPLQPQTIGASSVTPALLAAWSGNSRVIGSGIYV